MKKIRYGGEIDKMPNVAFRIMTLIFIIRNFFKPMSRCIDKFGIKKGSIVVDYGCGPGMHIKKASGLVGNEGLVYAVDIHELAIKSVKKLITKYKLYNLKTLQTDGNKVEISDNTADLIYALDMFHMVKDYKSFLSELNRIGKCDCTLILEDGHQPRKKSKGKVEKSGYWKIEKEYKKYMICKPK
jgi:ubiquinone/menaquinone biosynthesis C-methylase UbiE